MHLELLGPKDADESLLYTKLISCQFLMAQRPCLFYLCFSFSVKHTIHLNVCVCVCWNRKLGDGLFLECCKEVASGYPEITFDSMIVDNTTMQVATACLYTATLLISLCGGSNTYWLFFDRPLIHS